MKISIIISLLILVIFGIFSFTGSISADLTDGNLTVKRGQKRSFGVDESRGEQGIRELQERIERENARQYRESIEMKNSLEKKLENIQDRISETEIKYKMFVSPTFKNFFRERLASLSEEAKILQEAIQNYKYEPMTYPKFYKEKIK